MSIKQTTLAKLTRMMLNAVDKRLPQAERDLWQKQAWFMVKRLEAQVAGGGAVNRLIESGGAAEIASERGEMGHRAKISPRPGQTTGVSKCAQCGGSYTKKRKHQSFCSSKCRKIFWVKERTAHPSHNVWQKLDVILTKIDRIEKHLGIGGQS